MPHDHGHQHATGNTLRTAFLLTGIILVVEAAAGYTANSTALLADAGHILTDVAALGLAWFATRLSALPADQRNTFGYRRSAILAALANATLLVIVALAIAIEAVLRVRHPQHVNGGYVVIAAFIAIAVNTYIAFALRHEDGDLNVRAAMLHVVGDIAASIAVVVSGLLVLIWHAYLADPILSLGIAAFIAYGAWQIVRDTLVILMEGIPRGLDLDRVREAMMEVPGVEDVHDLHIWALSDGYRLLTAHISVPDQALTDTANLLSDLKLLLRRRFHIEHATIEPECLDCTVPQRRVVQFHPPEKAAPDTG
jgi:cobalt-zinc-cadmium efflux system protein